jgi:Rad3-related DNA helicase
MHTKSIRILRKNRQKFHLLIRYLLNPDKCFEEILKECRSVVLAGGTMKPISDFELLIGDKSRIEYFFHVIMLCLKKIYIPLV